MSDFLKTIGAIHVAEKLGSQGRALDSQNNKINELDETVDGLKKVILEKDKEIARLKEDLKFTENLVVEIQEREKKYIREVKKESEETEEYYRGLLSKPMNEIAKHNGNFKETYEKQQVLLADWIVSQKAFREVAMKYGTKEGKTKEEINEEGLETKQKVLLNQSEFANGNNAQSSELASAKRQELLDKFSKDKEKTNASRSNNT